MDTRTQAPGRTGWTISPEAPGSPAATALWRAYYTEVSDRWYELYHGRRTDPQELEREIAAADWSELRPPTGALLIARYGDEAAGCAGVRIRDATTGELKRVYVRPELRGKGGAALLLAAVEDAARALGAERVVLNTRRDLVEARALYARHGYAETSPYVEEAYAERFFEKKLGG
jgi:GNAT superfamily N-acetyltransferase